MATTINTYLSRVKLIQASSLTALETAINEFMGDSYTGDDALTTGEYVTRVDVDITSIRDVPTRLIFSQPPWKLSAAPPPNNFNKLC